MAKFPLIIWKLLQSIFQVKMIFPINSSIYIIRFKDILSHGDIYIYILYLKIYTLPNVLKNGIVLSIMHICLPKKGLATSIMQINN